MAECKLNYTADEINKKLGEVADQVFDSESENAQSGIALKDLVIKELVGDPNSTITYFYLQELKSGIYKAKVTSTNTNARIVVRAGTANTVNMRNGGILIVGNDYTINDNISFLTKGFMWVSNTAPRAGFVRTGKLICTRETVLDENDEPVLDEEGNEIKEWTYTVTSGDILNSNDKTSTINDDTDTSKIPTVNAVMNYIDDVTDGIANNVKLSNRQYEDIAEYTIEEEGITVYSVGKDKNNELLHLDNVVIYMLPPEVDTSIDIRVCLTLKDFSATLDSEKIYYFYSGLLNCRQYSYFEFRCDLLGLGSMLYAWHKYSMAESKHTDEGGTKIHASRFKALDRNYNDIYTIKVEAINDTVFPVGTKIIIKGVKRQ